jgi:tripartite-type tricarboxylate transporter receptor subunit TctC
MRTAIALLTALACVAPRAALAQAWPTKPVRIVAPYAPGGTADILSRAVAQKLTDAWGQQVLVENRPGASGMIGAELVAKAAPDGYTLLMAYTAEIAIVGSLFRKLAYDPVKDFAPVTLGAITPMIFVLHPSLPAKNVKELIALARAKRGELPYASAGSGSPAHLAFELLQRAAKIEINHVPYKGAAPALTDLLGGHVVMYFSGMPPAMPHVRSGRLRAIAVSTSKRSSAAPEVPTMIEAGVPGFDVPTWFGLLAPAGTPREVVMKINTDAARALTHPDVRDRLAREGAEVAPGTPEQFAKFIQAEIAKFAAIIRESGARPD